MPRLRRAVLTGLMALCLMSAGGPGARAAGEATSGSQRKATFSDTYVVVAPLMISVVQEGRVNGSLIVEIGLDIPDSALRARAERLMPRLQNRYVTSLNRFAATRVRMGEAPNVAVLAHLLQAGTDEVLGQGGAQVLLAQVVVRRAG